MRSSHYEQKEAIPHGNGPI